MGDLTAKSGKHHNLEIGVGNDEFIKIRDEVAILKSQYQESVNLEVKDFIFNTPTGELKIYNKDKK